MNLTYRFEKAEIRGMIKTNVKVLINATALKFIANRTRNLGF